MVEIFKYTERVVNMIRPRKLLFMAIGASPTMCAIVVSFADWMTDGVAPRAKMNQQRSRRFRAVQEAKEKDEARKEALQLWKCEFSGRLPRAVADLYSVAMGKTVSEDEENKKHWDSNAITPGTPFMTLLASSLRYWVAQKLNSDAGWKDVSHYSHEFRAYNDLFAAQSHHLGC